MTDPVTLPAISTASVVDVDLHDAMTKVEKHFEGS
jgi:hypothetical protein